MGMMKVREQGMPLVLCGCIGAGLAALVVSSLPVSAAGPHGSGLAGSVLMLPARIQGIGMRGMPVTVRVPRVPAVVVNSQ
jgi:hypothetical protein